MGIFINRLFEKYHVTPAIAWSMGGTLLQGLAGPIVALLIAHRFSPEMQGYYYTFASLLALSVFLELGFNGCIVQFISHEYAHLGMLDGRLNQKSARNLGRLASLTRLSLKWYMVAAMLLFFGVGIGGEIFFRHNQTDLAITWRGPWWWLCAFSAVNLMVLPLSALLDGCDQVNWTARARIFQNLGRSAVLICGLLLGLGLYAPAAATACALTVFFIQFYSKWRPLLQQILTCPVEEKVSWTKEILPMQWRIAISWASGYFIFSLFNPLLFSYAGAKVAGQFGMTWTILQAISSLSQSFILTRAPRFGVLTAKMDWMSLKKLWTLAIVQVLLLYFIGSAVFIIGLFLISIVNPVLRLRMVDYYSVILLCIAGFTNQIVASIAIVARAEKKEPFMWISVFVAIIISGLSLLMVKRYSVIGVSFGYLFGSFISVIWAFFILKHTLMFRYGRSATVSPV